MPSGAPPPMQFMPLQFAQPQDNSKQLQALQKALPGALGQQGLGSLLQQPGVPGTPGAAVPGATGPTSYGGPAGPAPLVPPGTAAPPAASPFPNPVGAAPPTAQDIGQNLARNLSPPQLLSILQQSTRTGQPISSLLPGGGLPAGTGLPSAGGMPPWMTGAGLLPGG